MRSLSSFDHALAMTRSDHFLISWRLFSPRPSRNLFSEVFDLKPTSQISSRDLMLEQL
jgi:hypothetical protein